MTNTKINTLLKQDLETMLKIIIENKKHMNVGIYEWLVESVKEKIETAKKAEKYTDKLNAIIEPWKIQND